MIGRTVVLFDRTYVWDLWGQGVVNGETQVQWRLSNTCDYCHRPMGHREQHGVSVPGSTPDDVELVCIDAERHAISPLPDPCSCHGLPYCPTPPDPPF